MTTSTTAHIINHTHWDREWFLTSVYTSRWIPKLIEKIEQLVADNPNYRFLFDGQTLVIEDLLEIAPGYAERVRRLVSGGHLIIGPYYCQPDWQLTGGELLIRNLVHGQQDVAHHGGRVAEAGWLVDTFGHIGQAPQIHRLFGVDAVFVWRGVPVLEPYFTWQGSDGSHVLTINLFGGYRNLYGVSRVPEVAVSRLETELRKLKPYYPTADVPLFDGYDLEDDPEDPLSFYAEIQGVGSDVNLHETTPTDFARKIAGKELSLPTVHGELNSGKYGATFPGTLSARTYLKVMASDCEQMLFKVVEPLAVLARLKGRSYEAAQYERWARLLLKNAVHDCICGVSIDQVHEKMEYNYRAAFAAMQRDAQESLAAALHDFQAGDYAVSTNALAGGTWQIVDGELWNLQTEGVGVWPVAGREPVERVVEPVEDFAWRNDHYRGRVRADGTVQVGEAVLGRLIVSAENGDAYSAEPGEQLGVIAPTTPPTVVEKSAHHAVVAFRGAWQGETAEAMADVRLHFDPSPLLRWEIDLDSRGTNLRVDVSFKTGIAGEINAGMPFDVVRRPAADTDFLPRELPDDLASVLLGQRELGAVSSFPFHDFVTISNGQQTAAIFSSGIMVYCADEKGTLTLPLRRAIEWLTRADLRDRVGDAGPFFYVPDARCERPVQHKLGVAVGHFAPNSLALQELNAGFQNPPVPVRVLGGGDAGTESRWTLLQEQVPLSSLAIREGKILARFYNPTGQPIPLSRVYRETDVWGSATGTAASVAPGKVVTVQLHQELAPVSDPSRMVKLLQPRPWRVGANQGLPDPDILDDLERKIAAYERQLEAVAMRLAEAEGPARLRLQHRTFVLRREQLEARLSLLLNRRKMAQQGALNPDYLFKPDPEIAEVGLSLNRLRMKRRIFDYVVQAL